MKPEPGCTTRHLSPGFLDISRHQRYQYLISRAANMRLLSRALAFAVIVAGAILPNASHAQVVPAIKGGGSQINVYGLYTLVKTDFNSTLDYPPGHPYEMRRTGRALIDWWVAGAKRAAGPASLRVMLLECAGDLVDAGHVRFCPFAPVVGSLIVLQTRRALPQSLMRPSCRMRNAKTADSRLEVRGSIVVGACYVRARITGRPWSCWQPRG